MAYSGESLQKKIVRALALGDAFQCWDSNPFNDDAGLVVLPGPTCGDLEALSAFVPEVISDAQHSIMFVDTDKNSILSATERYPKAFSYNGCLSDAVFPWKVRLGIADFCGSLEGNNYRGLVNLVQNAVSPAVFIVTMSRGRESKSEISRVVKMVNKKTEFRQAHGRTLTYSRGRTEKPRTTIWAKWNDENEEATQTACARAQAVVWQIAGSTRCLLGHLARGRNDFRLGKRVTLLSVMPYTRTAMESGKRKLYPMVTFVMAVSTRPPPRRKGIEVQFVPSEAGCKETFLQIAEELTGKIGQRNSTNPEGDICRIMNIDRLTLAAYKAHRTRGSYREEAAS
jgi:hypothetical protein